MLRICLNSISPDPTHATPVLRIGGDPTDVSPPDFFAHVTQNGESVLTLELYANDQEAQAFKDAVIWQDFAVVGWCERLYLVNLSSRQMTEHHLGSYFGYLHASKFGLFASSAERVFRIGTMGEIQWRSEVAGLDGVLIHDVSASALHGDGEWDAPGGWRPYRLDPTTGRVLPE